MLSSTDTIDRDTTARGTLDLGDTAVPFTEEQARAFLAECPHRPSIRACAAAWHWPKTRAERFLARLDAETKPAAPPLVPALAKSPAAKMTEDMRAAGASAEMIALAVETLAKITATQADEDKPFDWSDENKDVIVPEQRSIACYINSFGAIVIKEQSLLDDDVFICVLPEAATALIAKLQKLVLEASELNAEWRNDRGLR
jgi:hypothetical protein